MAVFGNGMKRSFFRGMEALGNKASQLAQSAQQRLERLNAERQLEELSLQVAQEARQLWESGEPLPQRISDLLTEQKQLEALLAKPEAEENSQPEEPMPDTNEEAD